MRGIKGIWAAAIVLSNLVGDGIRFLRGCVSSRTCLAAENLFLRKQLSFYQEHQIRPRRLTNSARVALVSDPDSLSGGPLSTPIQSQLKRSCESSGDK